MGDSFHSHLASPMHDLCAELLPKIIKKKKKVGGYFCYFFHTIQLAGFLDAKGLTRGSSPAALLWSR